MINTIPPGEECFNRNKANGLTRCSVFNNGKLEGLKSHLLDIGGWCVCLPDIEEDFLKLITRGRRFAGKSHSSKGLLNECHYNSACLWDENKDNLWIATGYALNRDGIWRQHSWCVFPTKRSWRVVETTNKNVQYFGYILHYREAENFCYENM